jgi:transcriptional regulator with XRE-family HTH domain
MRVSLRSRISLVKKLLTNKRFRDAYVAEHVSNGVAFQIRSMRDQRDWTQRYLGTLAGKPQNVISRLEDPDYGTVNLQTLLEIASAFDVALVVKFVPFSRLLKEYDNVSPDALNVESIFTEEPELIAWADDEAIETGIKPAAKVLLPKLDAALAARDSEKADGKR